MLEFLPPRLDLALRHINLNLLYELRVRADKPLRANINGSFCYVGEGGVCTRKEALVPTYGEIEEILLSACGHSLYTVENQIKQGFVTAKCGERIGIAGTFVYDGGQVLSVNHISSLCIRIPHAIQGCAEVIYERCFRDEITSVLILSPPGEGKTTILRDLCRLICLRTAKNVLVSDERGELSAGDLGETADVICFADKKTAFIAAIRAMRPEIIVTDELLVSDYAAVKTALESGIAVIASAHLKKLEDVPEKIFSRYVLLSGVGNVAKILDGEGKDVD